MSDQELSIDLRRLVQFLAVIEHESLTAAADRLAMTPQTLSTAMRQLEQSVGVSLFDRRGRRMLVTAAGQRLREGAPMLLAAATALVEATRQAATGRQASFVVGHTPAITAEEVFTIIEPVRARATGRGGDRPSAVSLRHGTGPARWHHRRRPT